MNWRIYRLPGSREIWHIDAGENTPVFNVRNYECDTPSRSDGNGGTSQPRSWIAVQGDLHIIGGIAVFSHMKVAEKISCAAIPSV